MAFPLDPWIQKRRMRSLQMLKNISQKQANVWPIQHYEPILTYLLTLTIIKHYQPLLTFFATINHS